MTQKEYYKLNIDDVIYNTKTNKIVKLNTGWTDTKIPDKNDSLSSQDIDNGNYCGIIVAECKDWKFVTDEAPIEIQFILLKKRFFELEAFVHRRLV